MDNITTKSQTSSLLVSLYLFLLIFFITICTTHEQKKEVPDDIAIDNFQRFFSKKNKKDKYFVPVLQDQQLTFYKKLYSEKIESLIKNNKNVSILKYRFEDKKHVISFSIPTENFFDVIDQYKIKNSKIELLDSLAEVMGKQLYYRLDSIIIFSAAYLPEELSKLILIPKYFFDIGINREQICLGINDSKDENNIVFKFFLEKQN